MEKVNFEYSTKSIPVPDNDAFLRTLIGKIEKITHRMRWKANFFLKPETKPAPKETYGFKSTSPAPFVPLLKPFENGLADLLKNVKFGRKPNHFQQKLKQDEKKIKSEQRPYIKADKSNNFYKMECNQYNELLEKEIQELKKDNNNSAKSVTSVVNIKGC